MKLLFDQNLSFRLCEQIDDIFPGSDHVGRRGLAQADDRDIWQFAKANNFTIVSQDADFAEMGLILGSPPKVIWIRSGNRPSAAVAALLRFHSSYIAAFENDDAVCFEIY